MKLAPKLALCVVAMMGLVFAVAGRIMIASNFYRSLNSAVQQHTAAHLASADALGGKLARAHYTGQTLHSSDFEAMGRELAPAAAPGGGSLAVLNDNGTPFFNSLPSGFNKSVQKVIVDAPQPGYLYYRFDGRTYLAMPAHITSGGQSLWLISAFDITGLFAERQTQTGTFYVVYGVVLLVSTLLGAVLAATLARPMKKLTAASREIAGGAYSRRTGIDRQDEIGQLAQSFDAMAAAVEEKVEQLELSVQQRQDFVSAFTHELKTPMTAMMGYSALLQQRGLSAPEQEKALAYIHSQTARLENLSQKLLALMGLADADIQREAVPLEAVLQTVGNAFLPLPKTQLHLPPGNGLAVMADADLLADLLINLVQNALQADGDGTGVTVTARQQGQTVVLSVSDKGPGLTTQQIERIEEPFYRVDKSRASGGTGLGLALAARIAAAHNSRLEYQSENGRGTTVTLRLTAASKEEPS